MLSALIGTSGVEMPSSKRVGFPSCTSKSWHVPPGHAVSLLHVAPAFAPFQQYFCEEYPKHCSLFVPRYLQFVDGGSAVIDVDWMLPGISPGVIASVSILKPEPGDTVQSPLLPSGCAKRKSAVNSIFS